MNVTDNVIRDLLPLYADDAVTQDTRNLVEEYLRLHPELSKELTDTNPLLPISRLGVDTRTELASLNATKRRLNMRSIWMGLGIFFCASLIGFTFDGEGHTTWIWASFPFGSVIASVLGFFSWLMYGLSLRRTRATGI